MLNLKKEAEWERKKYKRYQFRCPKDTAEQLDEKLKADKLTFSQWMKEQIKKYLKGGE